MKTYTVTIKQQSSRTVRSIIAASSMKAVQIALGLVPDSLAPFRLSCKVASSFDVCLDELIEQYDDQFSNRIVL